MDRHTFKKPFFIIAKLVMLTSLGFLASCGSAQKIGKATQLQNKNATIFIQWVFVFDKPITEKRKKESLSKIEYFLNEYLQKKLNMPVSSYKISGYSDPAKKTLAMIKVDITDGPPRGGSVVWPPAPPPPPVIPEDLLKNLYVKETIDILAFIPIAD